MASEGRTATTPWSAVHPYDKGYPMAVDALADELLVALRDHPANVLSPEAFAQDGGRLQAAYNRLYCELHDKATDA